MHSNGTRSKEGIAQAEIKKTNHTVRKTYTISLQ